MSKEKNQAEEKIKLELKYLNVATLALSILGVIALSVLFPIIGPVAGIIGLSVLSLFTINSARKIYQDYYNKKNAEKSPLNQERLGRSEEKVIGEIQKKSEDIIETIISDLKGAKLPEAEKIRIDMNPAQRENIKKMTKKLQDNINMAIKILEESRNRLLLHSYINNIEEILEKAQNVLTENDLKNILENAKKMNGSGEELVKLLNENISEQDKSVISNIIQDLKIELNQEARDISEMINEINSGKEYGSKVQIINEADNIIEELNKLDNNENQIEGPKKRLNEIKKDVESVFKILEKAKKLLEQDRIVNNSDAIENIAPLIVLPENLTMYRLATNIEELNNIFQEKTVKNPKLGLAPDHSPTTGKTPENEKS